MTATDPPIAAGHHTHIPLTAVLLIVVASACFTTVDVTVKHLSQRYPVPLLVWARWGVQLLLTLAIVGPRLRWDLVRTDNLPLQLVRGAVLVASGTCFFTALKFMPIAEATALNYTAPMLVTLMAGFFLGERLTKPRWAFIVSGFIGMLVIVRPGTEVLNPAAFFALAGAGLYATFQILTRKLAGENLMVLLFYPCVVGTVVMSLVVPFFHYSAWYPISDILLFLGIGVMGFVGHMLFIRAFQVASASAIAPFTYMQLIWSTLAGWLVFGSFPDGWTMTGIVVIAGSGIVLTWYERWSANIPQSDPVAVD
ncbi:MAG: DMT family transporter [Casimicrobiaceae bacterium]